MTARPFTPPFGPNDPFTVADIVIASSPDYVAKHDNGPLYAHEHWLLLTHCRTALDRRRAAYPKMIERCDIMADEAARDIAAWEMLVDEWRWILSGQRQPPARHTINERLGAVDLAVTRVQHELRRHNAHHEMYRQAHLLQALQWHLVHQLHGEPRVHSMARVNHRYRAAEAVRYCETCDRWSPKNQPTACTRVDCGLADRAQSERSAA